MKSASCNTLVYLTVLLLSGACSIFQLEPVTPFLPTATSSPLNTATPTTISVPVNSATPLPPSPPIIQTKSPVPSPSHTPFEIPIDTLDHPLSIEVMRRREYPGSLIIIEQILEPGSNYSRYYVSYRSDGLKIYALMTVPDGDKPVNGWPVVIFNHGYIDPDNYRSTERYIEHVDEIARNGYIVFRSDYRGHGQSEGVARGAYGYPDYTIDVLNAVASMKAYRDADPDRIGMWGHSMGGYITLRSMVITKDIKIGVIWAGVVAPYPDLVYKWTQPAADIPASENTWRTSLEAEYGTPSQNPAFWDAISANSYLTELSGPIQLQHGTGDAEVPVDFSTNLYQHLMIADIPVELYTYENDNHNLSNSFEVAMRRTLQTFDIYLK